LTTATAIGTAQNSSQDRITKRIPYPSFELNVLVDGRPLTEYRSHGRAYVDAVRGAEYELRLRNSSPDRVAVALSVDGLNTIDAQQTSAWNASKWVIEPYQTITISGWQMSSERARRFYFTTERDSYAEKLGRRADLGVISAVFFRERNRPVPITRSSEAPRPSDSAAGMGGAQPQLRADASREKQAATGIGRSVRNDVREIDMDLESRPAAELTVRYEYARSDEYSRNRFCPEP
jgi:hypothetical protein